MSQSILVENEDALERRSVYQSKSLIDIAWGAGILEGEGSFTLSKDYTRKTSYRCAIQCFMTDLDTLEHLHSVFGVGSITKNKPSPNRKQVWRWLVTKQRDIYTVLMQIEPFLMSRRKDKARELLEYMVPRLIARGELEGWVT